MLLQVGRARAVQLLRWNLMRRGPADKRGGGGGGGGRTHTPEMVTGWGYNIRDLHLASSKPELTFKFQVSFIEIDVFK